MTRIQKITSRDDPDTIAATAAANERLLLGALEIAQHKARRRSETVLKVLATASVEGLSKPIGGKIAAVTFRAREFKCTWHTLIPWQNLKDTTPEEEADMLLATVVRNVDLARRGAWPSSIRKDKGSSGRPTRRSTRSRAKTRAPC